MIDIYVGLFIIGVLSAGLFFLGSHIAKTKPNHVFHTVTLGSIGLLFLYSKFLLNSCYLSWILPFSNLVVLGSWFPLIAAFLAGLGWQKIPGKLMRKCLYVVPLILASLYSSYGFFLKAVPMGDNLWKDGVSLQSSDSSCGAACAATLLKAHNIDSNETEMIKLCLTRETGTLLYGLYRGLKLKTTNSQWNVEIFQWSLLALRHNKTWPVIIQVKLEKNADADPKYYQKWGWIPGVTHTVVLFGFRENNRIEIGDPAVGREHWHVESLEVLWHGQGIRLIPR